ncbi:MAG: type I pantothenate kinase [Propionibacteriaceae bacterium]
MITSTSARCAGPYAELSRAEFAALAREAQLSLDEYALEQLRGNGDPTNMLDVTEVYLPLSQLIGLYIKHTGQLYEASNRFLRLATERTPFVIGIAGSVAVGKSTTARILQALLASAPGHPHVDLVTTDGFLYPNAVLEERGLMERKGFPESYDQRALLSFVTDVKSGVSRVEAPVYSHQIYDIIPDEKVIVAAPDILIVEGLNVLQPARRHADGTRGLSISDFFDFSVYVDADVQDIRRWYIERFQRLRDSAKSDPDTYFRRYVELPDDEAITMAKQVWDAINGPNLEANVRPTRSRATAILRKGSDHSITGVRIRKI